MGMIGFHSLFPGEAANECRTVTPVGSADLPSRTFVFMEAYCINYAFEPPKPPFER